MPVHHIPLLKDHHTHPLFYASCLDGLDIRQLQSKAAALGAIRERADDGGHELLIVLGWVDSNYRLTADEIAHSRPIVVFNLSLHRLIMNAVAEGTMLDRCGTEIEGWRDQDWYERHFRQVLNCFARLNASVDRLQRFYSWLEETHGVGYAEELLLVDEHEIQLFADAELLDRTRLWAAPETYADLSADNRRRVHGIKLFSDGALGVRTAALHQPYDSGETGMLMYDDDALRTELTSCFSLCSAVAIHAIGDRAIDQVVDAVADLGPDVPEDAEIRIEHAQLISESTANRAKQLGIKLSMQPNFSADSTDYRDRLAPDYLAGNNPFRMLIDRVGYVAGEDLIFGSDGMPHGVEEALQQSLFPPFPAQQRLTLVEFKAGYCLSDESEGTIEVDVPAEYES